MPWEQTYFRFRNVRPSRGMRGIGIAFLATLAAAMVLATWTAAAQAQVHTQDPRTAVYEIPVFLHRDGSMNGVAPTGSADATASYGLLAPRSFHWKTAPLARDLDLHGPSTFTVWVGTEIDLSGHFQATLDVDGTSIASADAEHVLLNLAQARQVVITFPELSGTVPAGKSLGVTLTIIPLLDLLPAPLPGILDVKVDVLYDSTAHQGGLSLLGVGPRNGGLVVFVIDPPSNGCATAGACVPANGTNGAPGINGANGANGANGGQGPAGPAGQNGANGWLFGPGGSDGASGANAPVDLSLGTPATAGQSMSLLAGGALAAGSTSFALLRRP
jgi:hypothetical protein